MTTNGSGVNNSGNLRNLDNIVLDENVPTDVHLKFKDGVDVYDAFTELGLLLHGFYSKEFQTRDPYPGIRKRTLKPITRGYHNRGIDHGFLTLILSGVLTDRIYQGKRFAQLDKEVTLAFFNIFPSSREGFDYQMNFSRRVNDFSTHKYEGDHTLSVQDRTKFYRYITGLLEKTGILVNRRTY